MLYGALRALRALWKDGYLREEGWFRSFREREAIDGSGRPIPWMNYCTVQFLRERLKPGFRVFEFGSGNSTLFFASRCAEVVSFEPSPEWFRKMSPRVPPNVRLMLRETEAYYCCEEESGSFDVVVIDAMDRNRLIDPALKLCREGSGVIVWDDSERPEYAPAIARLLDSGWKRLRLSGIGPIQNCRKETSFFYRPGNCLEI